MAKQKHDLLSILITEYGNVIKELMEEAVEYKTKIDSAKTKLKRDFYRKKLQKVKDRIQDLSMKLARLKGEK